MTCTQKIIIERRIEKEQKNRKRVIEQKKSNHGKINSEVIWEEERPEQKYPVVTIPWHHTIGKKEGYFS